MQSAITATRQWRCWASEERLALRLGPSSASPDAEHASERLPVVRVRCQEHHRRDRDEQHRKPNRLEEQPHHNEDYKTSERGEVKRERAHRRSDENGGSAI
jgi:hypothetical protein